MGVSADQQYLVSGGKDGTVAIWPLGDYRAGKPEMRRWGAEFEPRPNGGITIRKLDSQGPLYNRGLADGDVLTRIQWPKAGDTKNPYQESRPDLILKKLRAEQPAADQGSISFYTTRNGAPQHNAQTLPYWHPLLMLYTHEHEWIAWTPTGYYDASAAGERLIGWQFTRHLGEAPFFATAEQYYRDFHKPELIQNLLPTASLSAAAEKADIAKIEVPTPERIPKVTLLEPSASFVAQRGPDLLIRAEIEPPTNCKELHVMLMAVVDGEQGGSAAEAKKIRHDIIAPAQIAAGKFTSEWLVNLDEEQARSFFDRRPEVPTELAAIVSRLLAKNPADRFTSAADLANVLIHLANGSNLIDLIGAADEKPRTLNPRDRTVPSTSDDCLSATIDYVAEFSNHGSYC
jgi:serine/threonine protein kinase